VGEISLFFITNRPLIYFIGGLSFFSMGLASVIQRRRYSRLRLARYLGLLAGFGLLYGLNEWGNLLVPLQEQLPVPAAVTRLAVVQLLARGLALALLFQFGIELLRPPLHRWRFFRFLPSIFVFLWGAALVHLWVGMRAPGELIFSAGDLLARYFLGIPAAALSCLGLLEQRREVREAGFPQISRYLMGAAVSLGFFGAVGVLLGVAGPFFPGNWLSYPAILYTIGVFVPILRALDGIAMAFFTGRALEVFEAEAEALVLEVERRNVLLADRERIGRELHDGIIQSLYAAGLRLEDACHTVDESPREVKAKLRGVMGGLNQVIQEIRAYIFDLQKPQMGGTLVQRLEELVHELRLNTMLEAGLIVNGHHCPVPAERVSHLVQIAQEALSNVVRHARAAQVIVELEFSPDTLHLVFRDDGVGFDVDEVLRNGNGLGLRNVCERAGMLGGEVHIESHLGGGTVLNLRVPCPCDIKLCELEVKDDTCTVASAAR
jgi:signal transduction histidine kinase